MKLRYLRVQRSRPPLRDLALTFPHNPLLSAQPLALRFIVGLNGTGKTTLLQTLAEIFAALDRDGRPPAFPLWLAYDLQMEERARTVYLSAPGGQPPALIVFDGSLPEDTDWDALAAADPRAGAWPAPVHRQFIDELPGGGVFDLFLPSAVLAYTSGETRGWEALFAPAQPEMDESAWSALTPEDARPSDWDVARENELRQRLGQPSLQAASPEILAARISWPRNAFFIDDQGLALAAAIVLLQHLASEGKDEAWQAILNELRLPWQAPLALSLWVNLDPDRLDAARAATVADLMKLAVTVAREPEPSVWRQLVFDLLARVPARDFNTSEPPAAGDLLARGVLEVLGGGQDQLFNAFRTLSSWQQDGFARDARLVVRKRDAEDALLYDWLSDGERMLLGRAALFHLLRDESYAAPNALLILDEPETHFNDAWKRRLVDMLDDALRDSAHQVVVSTHSSILLSDVFTTEMSVLRDDTVYEPSGGTFGTLPSEIMRAIFDTGNPVGDRAQEFLDPVLALAEVPELAERLWRAFDETPEPVADAWMGEDHPFGAIIRRFGHSDQLPRRTPQQWLRLFKGLYRNARARGRVTLAAVLEALFDHVGAGYYQFELRRQHRHLTQAGEEHAAPR